AGLAPAIWLGLRRPCSPRHGCGIEPFPAPRGAGVTADDARIDRDRTGTPDQIPLHLVAALSHQRLELFVGLDTLGKRRQPQSMRKADDGADDGERSVRAAQACDEYTVDLHSIERKRLQI